MNHILLLEDIPEIRAWLKVLVNAGLWRQRQWITADRDQRVIKGES